MQEQTAQHAAHGPTSEHAASLEDSQETREDVCTSSTDRVRVAGILTLSRKAVERKEGVGRGDGDYANGWSG